MKLLIDTDNKVLTVTTGQQEKTLPLFSKDAFELLSAEWIKVGWDQKYTYNFSWMGRPIIQLPEDMIRTQEVIYKLKPTKIIETGVAHGGSLIYYASLMRAFGIDGKVIGVDIEIREHNRKAIEAHELSNYIELVEGDSVADPVVDKVSEFIEPSDKVLVILDSNHSKSHVYNELLAYHKFVTADSYIVATDGVMQNVYESKLGQPEWKEDNPSEAAKDFVREFPQFKIEQPEWSFKESNLEHNVTHWPDAWIRRT